MMRSKMSKVTIPKELDVKFQALRFGLCPGCRGHGRASAASKRPLRRLGGRKSGEISLCF